MSQRPPAEEILAALKRTVSRGSTRIEFRREFCFDTGFLKSPSTRRPSGSLRRLMWRGGLALLRVFLSGMLRLLRGWSRKRQEQPWRGVIDFGRMRCMYRYPGQPRAVLVAEDEMWEGPPGTPLDTLSTKPASRSQPLWLLDILRGVVAAQEHTADELDGRPCRRFTARADLNRAAKAVSRSMAIPSSTDRLDDLEHIPVEVWVDDGGDIRRVRHIHTNEQGIPISTTTVDVIELGIELPSDWSRLPTSF